jgi:hypothetical protein
LSSTSEYLVVLVAMDWLFSFLKNLYCHSINGLCTLPEEVWGQMNSGFIFMNSGLIFTTNLQL